MSKPTQELESLLLSSRVGKSANEHVYFVSEKQTPEAYNAIVNKTHKLKKGNTYVLQSLQGDFLVYISPDDAVAREELFLKKPSSAEQTGVESVTGDLVSGTAENPVINLPSDVLKDSDTSSTPSAGKIPVYSSQGLLSTGMPTSPQNAIPLSLFNSMLSESPVGGKIPIYSEQGLLSTGTPEFPENAVPLAYLDARVPTPNESGSFVLKSVDGVVSWVAE